MHQKKIGFWVIFLGALFSLPIPYPVMAKKDSSAIDLLLQAVQKDTPVFERSPEQKLGVKIAVKMIKIRGNSQLKKLPATEANILYFGKITLGSPACEYGILIDFEGKEKLMWVDGNGNGNYAEETPYSIFKSDRFLNENVYYSPTPINFHVKYQFGNDEFQTQLQLNITYLFIARSGFEDYLYLKTRTWFVGIIDNKGTELRVALVDTNDNGFYNDPSDLIFIDSDYDFNFLPKEGKSVQSFQSFKVKPGPRWEINYESAPEKLVLKER